MALHQTSGQTRLGIALAMITMLTWATLPVALSVLLKELDPMTLTWFRFALSSVLLAAVLCLIFCGVAHRFGRCSARSCCGQSAVSTRAHAGIEPRVDECFLF